MNKKRYKDLLATGIVFGIFAVIGLAFVFGYYATQQMKEYFVMGIFGCCVLAFIWAIWKLIRAIID